MFRFAVCDDMVQDLNHTKELLTAYRQAHPAYEIELSIYTDPYRLLTEFECGIWHDVYFLDVLMPGIDGVELGRVLRHRNDRCVILYGTITPEFALDSFHVGAQNYLLKPFQRKEFFEALDRAVSFLDIGQAHGVSIRTPGGVHFLPFHKIVYVESKLRGMEFHTPDGMTLESVKLRGRFEDALADLLSDPRFCQPHKSYAVNMDYVRFQGGGHMELLTGAVIPVSSSRRTAILDQFMEHSMMRKNKEGPL